MTSRIYIWPDEFNRSISSNFTLGALNGSSQPIFLAAPSVFAEPFDHRWFATIQAPAMGERETVHRSGIMPSWRELEGRVAALKGISGRLRLFDPCNVQPAYNLYRSAVETPWSDGRTFTDGREWITGFLPPYLTVDAVAYEGANSIVVRGLPPDTARVMRIGDRIEIRPNGEAADFGMYHILTEDSRSDADGKTRLYVEPGLRRGVNIADQIVLKYPTTVFSLIDDKQGVVTRNEAAIGSFGWSLVETLPLDQ